MYRSMKANKVVAGSVCKWCNGEINLGDDVAICESCETPHHLNHWTEHDGCSNSSCANAPFKQIADPVSSTSQKTPSRPGYSACPHCGYENRSSAYVCVNCRRPTSPDGLYKGPTSLHSGARNALIMGIVGFFLFGLILGILAIRRGNKAKEEIQSDYTLHGEGVATAAVVLGWIDVIAWAILIFMR